ncbi:MAG: hypothetical protein ACE10O_08835, partial [Candidatus Acidiferrales bacterium]
MITKEDLPELRLKLEHPVYQSRMQQLQKLAGKGDMAANALLYLAGYGDQYGQKAKSALLLEEWSGGSGDAAGLRGYSAVATYDWVFELMTPTEREQAFQNVHGMLLATISAGSAPGGGGQGFYASGPYGRWPGFFRPWLGLAAKGEGVDDTTVEEILVHAYGDIQDDQHWGMYEPERGKAVLDVLNTIGLDTGGSQAGNHINSPTSGYTSMYLKGGPLFVFGWDTATGGTERVAARCSYARYLAHWLTYESNRWRYEGGRNYSYIPTGYGTSGVIEYLTGVYKDIDPDMAALAACLLEVCDINPRGYYNWIVPALILGDLRVQPKSPEQLGLPTAAYLRGADAFYSMSSWKDDATRVVMNIRYLDTNRYEPSSNTFRISRFGFLATGSQTGKDIRGAHNHAGIWFYEPEDLLNQEESTYWSGARKQQGTTFWGGLQYKPKPKRATGARQVAENPAYRAGGPSAVGVHESYRFATSDAARTMKVRLSAVKRYERTLLHLLPVGPDREYVVVHDRT